MAAFHGDLDREPHGSAMEYHDRALEEVERAFAGWAEQEVAAALERAIRTSGLELIRPAFGSALAASRPRAELRRIASDGGFQA